LNHASVPVSNQLIAALPAAELAQWSTRLEPVHLTAGGVLHEPGEVMDHIYFPTTAVVSLLYTTARGASAEIAMVGYEGLVGISLLLGGETTPHCAIVQSAGFGYRLTAAATRAEFQRSMAVKDLLLRYTQALITQMTLTAACNRHHALEQQVCRWLLMRLDRLQGSELTTTHEQIANLLGVRREGVTEAASRLQQAGLIRYSRGRVEVIDRPGLERRCCECYAVVKKEYDRLLPAPAAR
jgi:CRP-like cAMP-binding protein